MKFIIPLFFLVIFAFQSLSQTTQPFKIEVGKTLNLFSEKYVRTQGRAVYMEPKHMLGKCFQIGLRLEPGILSNGARMMGANRNSIRFRAAPLVLTTAVAVEYIRPEDNRKAQPFIGFFAAHHFRRRRVAILEAINGGPAVERVNITGFGLGPRLGLNVGPLRFLTILSVLHTEFSNYASFSIGYEFGFRRRD